LTPTEATESHCGNCTACLSACPTQAIVAPYQLDARRCISYWTIEHEGAIPTDFRPLMGNRIYGCDDCQLACPWNKYAQRSALPDFDPREGLKAPSLIALWQWDEAQFLRYTEGSAIRRIGHERWLRNLAVAMGNALRETQIAAVKNELRHALAQRSDHASPVVREHLQWALAQEAVD
jgi:epoxyqueuosine reductase